MLAKADPLLDERTKKIKAKMYPSMRVRYKVKIQGRNENIDMPGEVFILEERYFVVKFKNRRMCFQYNDIGKIIFPE